MAAVPPSDATTRPVERGTAFDTIVERTDGRSGQGAGGGVSAGDENDVPTRRTKPLAITLYAVPLGLAGFGGAWAAAATVLHAPRGFSDGIFGLSAFIWLVLTAIYLWQGFWDGRSFSKDVQHPAAGPFTSFIPLVAILLSAHYSDYSLAVGRWVCILAILSLVVLSARLLAYWVTVGTTTLLIHPGYFIPLVAGPFVASIGFSSVNAHQEAIAAFGVGIFFWPVLAAVILGQLMTGRQIPLAVVPNLSAFLATAATGNVAWFVSHPGPLGEAQYLLTGVLVMMIFVQLAFLVEYHRLSFSMAFWAFTFPVCVTSNYTIRLFGASHLSGRTAVGWTALGLASAFVSVIALGSLQLLRGRLTGRYGARADIGVSKP
jgi:tellurite resistance protein